MSTTKITRNLGLTTPYAHGEDVRTLQRALNARLKARGRKPIKVDGQYGTTTQAAVRKVLWFLGCPSKNLDLGASTVYQRIIEDPDTRPGTWNPIAKDRVKYLATHKNEASAIVSWAATKVGIHETPIDSNRGPVIDLWEKECGFQGAPYCGMFVVYALRHIAGIGAPSNWAYTPNILADARAGKYGMKLHPPSATPKKGWIVLMDFVAGGPEVMHTGFYVGNGENIEGNTSPTAGGSQDNGGGVYRKKYRDRRAFVVGLVEPPYGK